MPSDKPVIPLPDSCLVAELQSLLRQGGDCLLAVFRSTASEAATAAAIRCACRLGGADAADGAAVLVCFNGRDSFRLGLPEWLLTASASSPQGGTVAIAHQPFTGEWFISAGGLAVHSRAGTTAPLRTRPGRADAPLIVGIGDGSARATAAEREALRALRTQAGLTQPLSTAYGLCLLAMGLLDVMVDTAGADDLRNVRHIVRAAGGRVTDWCGAEPGTGPLLAAGNLASHRRALQTLAWGGLPPMAFRAGSGGGH